MTRVTLSFDNGPDREVTPRVLDLLGARGFRAHFFVLGKHLAERSGRALVARAFDEGHLIGNHSYSHGMPLGVDAREDAVEAEIAATEALLSGLTPGEKRFRPFGGGGVIGPHLLSARAVDYLVMRAYTCVLWNSVPRDWEDPKGGSERALDDCETRAHTLLVLHDIPGACLDGLARFLDQATARGFEFSLELPPECVPIVGGRVVGDLRTIVAKGDVS
jgi:peptidoglycan/xylan/chitin deacetylase (PgdA/CDA1 family)